MFGKMLNIIKKHKSFFVLTVIVIGSFAFFVNSVRAVKASSDSSEKKMLLKENWFIKSSAKEKKCGKVISAGDFVPGEDWYKTDMPSTVMSVLVKHKAVPDPYVGKNMKNISKKMFKKPWWYRTEFHLPENYKNKKIWLHLDGIIYKADIWLNGKLVAGKKEIEGVYKLFKLDVTDIISYESKNFLAIKVFPIKPGDLSIGFVDWNPFPPDNNIGIWKDVYVRATGSGVIRHPFVVTDLDLPSYDTARLSVTAEVYNAGQNILNGKLEGRIGSITFSQEIEINSGETKLVSFKPEEFSQLIISDPKLWWPNNVGPQNLYRLELLLKVNDEVSDANSTNFGIREVSSFFNDKGYRGFNINGKKVLIRGGGWTDDLMLENRDEVVEAKVRYAKNMNLNTIRVEGIWGKDFLYDKCDELGILVLAGWTCHWEWDHYLDVPCDEYGGIYGKASMDIAVDYWREVILRLRNHPCIFAWMYGSDKPPRPELEKRYIKIHEEYDPTRPYTSSATDRKSEITGKTGVKMYGPYDYVPPAYYYFNNNAGGAFGFATEEGPGATIPRVESMRKMLHEDELWPINDVWFYHSSTRPRDLKANTFYVKTQYGEASGIEDYCAKSQLMNYDAARGLFEAWGRNKYLSTGIINWMYNASWPSVCWQLFDHYLLPGGAFYGTQEACEPLHAQFSYDDNSVVVVNSYYKDFKGLKVSADIYNIDASRKYSKTVTVDAGEDSSNRAFFIDMPQDLSQVFFLKLELKDSGKPVSSNFYCLSKNSTMKIGLEDELFKLKEMKEAEAFSPFADEAEYMYNSPADFKGLAELPEVELDVKGVLKKVDEGNKVEVSIRNPSENIAFFVQLDVTKGQGGEPVVPVYWEENYVSLLPGEELEVSAVFSGRNLDGMKPFIKVKGCNVPIKTIKIGE